MKNDTLARRLWRDRSGATFLEFTAVFPLLMLTAFCTVDFALVMWDWSQANKAAQRGARVAIVAEPVASDILDVTWNPLLIGEDCAHPATGQNLNCPTSATVCTAGPPTDVCTNAFTFDNDAFTAILDEMQRVFPRLQRQNVQVSYRTTGLGFVGRPGGLPMEVTVEIRCMTHEVFFLAALAGWAFPGEGCWPRGVPIPAYATTLTSEALGS